MEDETDRLLMLGLGAFKRRVEHLWINPSKSGWVRENHGVSHVDESPEGKYPGMIVPTYDLDKVMVIIPEDKFKVLLEAWKKTNRKFVKAVDRITQEERQQKALSHLRYLFSDC